MDNAAYQNLAYSDIINIEIARLWEDGHCNTNQKIKEIQRNKKLTLPSS